MNPVHRLRLVVYLLVAAVILPVAGRAHTVWIEAVNGALVVRFAEPGEEFEKSPGYLDALTLPVAFITEGQKPKSVSASREADGFALGRVASSNIACAETTFTVRGGRKPIFYARWQPVGADAGVPLLTFDLVPTGAPGEVRIYFRGKPLGGQTATLRSPDGTTQDITADAGGLIHFEAKQHGPYLLTVPHYREALPGFHGGVPYSETSHNAALSWNQR